MIRALKDLLASLTSGSAAASPADQEHQLRLATAVLLVETMRADPEVKDAERQVVMSALRRKFELSPEELAQLLQLAEEKARTANDYFAFTSMLNERFTQPQKIRIIEFMWQVAYADGAIDENENHLISKVAGLLHVTHGEYIAAKLHAREAAGPGAS